ncbi:MAG: gliding motility lipoprotein GldD [Chitinophagaceae bacterium]
MKRLLLLLFLAFLTLSGCNPPYTPKPRGYFQIDFPIKKYRLFDRPGYPYTFEYPVYARVVKDSLFFGHAPENPYWINVDFPGLNGKIYLTYKEIDHKNPLNLLINQSFELTNKHMEKADYIRKILFHTQNQVSGLFFEVGGNAASAKQFFATDSTKHFLRGALYFYAVPNADSLAPVNQFVEQDMRHLINTLNWR